MSSELIERFVPLIDLGVITIPENYKHASRLASFRKENHGRIVYYHIAISDMNFPNPSRQLRPGEKLRVRVWKQVGNSATTSEECVAFLRTQPGNMFTGAQGVSLVFEQKRDQLQMDKEYASFDEVGRLWRDARGYHGVPYMSVYPRTGKFGFRLGCFEDVWPPNMAFFSFCDE